VNESHRTSKKGGGEPGVALTASFRDGHSLPFAAAGWDALRAALFLEPPLLSNSRLLGLGFDAVIVRAVQLSRC
jgi:hypothetical protein